MTVNSYNLASIIELVVVETHTLIDPAIAMAPDAHRHFNCSVCKAACMFAVQFWREKQKVSVWLSGSAIFVKLLQNPGDTNREGGSFF